MSPKTVRGERGEVLKLGEKLDLGEELGSMVEDPEACVSHA